MSAWSISGLAQGRGASPFAGGGLDRAARAGTFHPADGPARLACEAAGRREFAERRRRGVRVAAAGMWGLGPDVLGGDAEDLCEGVLLPIAERCREVQCRPLPPAPEDERAAKCVG